MRQQIKTQHPPDWDLVAFDVACARCGHDVRGQSEPLCPACGLAFDWDDAVPLEHLTCLHCGYHLYGLKEPRCPECGERFDWSQVLAAYRHRQQPLFEFRWRTAPFRSLVRTWLWAMTPKRLWSRVDIHVPPRPGPLLAMTAIVLLGVAISLPILEAVAFWLELMRGILGGTSSSMPGMSIFEVVSRALTEPHSYMTATRLIIWSVTTLVALLVFQQSMRRCKVHAGHVLRVWAYTIVMLLPPAVLLLGALEFATTYSRSLFFLAGPINLFILGYAGWLTWQGYKRYLHMPHGLFVAAVSQFIALLFSEYLMMAIMQATFI